MSRLKDAQQELRKVNISLRRIATGEYVVNFLKGKETSAYYTDDLEDAIETGFEMAKRANKQNPSQRNPKRRGEYVGHFSQNIIKQASKLLRDHGFEPIVQKMEGKDVYILSVVNRSRQALNLILAHYEEWIGEGWIEKGWKQP